jgi:hypothetical protein
VTSQLENNGSLAVLDPSRDSLSRLLHSHHPFSNLHLYGLDPIRILHRGEEGREVCMKSILVFSHHPTSDNYCTIHYYHRKLDNDSSILFFFFKRNCANMFISITSHQSAVQNQHLLPATSQTIVFFSQNK